MPKMEAPASGVKVRMYRQGHGDCFLLAFRDDNGEPFYFLIDCGLKPGSEVRHKIQDVVDDIGEATENHLNVVLITHEHQDHVNGFWNQSFGNEIERFENIAVDHLWLAWTEDPNDDVANALRQRYGDTLISLMAAEEQLRASPEPAIQQVASRVEELLGFEMEGEGLCEGDGRRLNDKDRQQFLQGLVESRNAVDSLGITGITNKKAIRYIKDKTGRKPLYLSPERKRPYWLPNVEGVSIYALGPPRDETLLLSLDPIGREEFSPHMVMSSDAESFQVAAVNHSTNPALDGFTSGEIDEMEQPFAPRHRIPKDKLHESEAADFFNEHYGTDNEHDENWRSIDHDWLRSAETLALRLNGEVNNTSLVIAIELPGTQKVLLFVGDAQRGNWLSWDDQTWTNPDGNDVSCKDLLGRTVLYKVGHHGSHNATLKGRAGSDYPNLAWMGRDEQRDDFTAMIPANRPWAFDKARWKHPLPSIERALKRKARGRVFRTDVDQISKPSYVSDSEWQEFEDRTTANDLYFEFLIPD